MCRRRIARPCWSSLGIFIIALLRVLLPLRKSRERVVFGAKLSVVWIVYVPIESPADWYGYIASVIRSMEDNHPPLRRTEQNRHDIDSPVAVVISPREEWDVSRPPLVRPGTSNVLLSGDVET